jgi:hypothetical protein
MAKADLARSRARFAPFLLFAFAATTACEDKVPANLVSQKPNALQRVVGVAEVTLHDLNSPSPARRSARFGKRMARRSAIRSRTK